MQSIEIYTIEKKLYYAKIQHVSCLVYSRGLDEIDSFDTIKTSFNQKFMKQITNSEKVDLWEGSSLSNSKLQRRSFLQFAGVGVAGAALLAVGCKKDAGTDSLQNTLFADKNSADGAVDLGSGDVGILN